MENRAIENRVRQGMTVQIDSSKQKLLHYKCWIEHPKIPNFELAKDGNSELRTYRTRLAKIDI